MTAQRTLPEPDASFACRHRPVSNNLEITPMQAYRIYSGRNENALERFELKTRSLAVHEIRVRVRAVSLNYRDLMIERGDYPLSDEHPPIAVADGAGEVIAVGAGVTRFRERDRVAGIYFANWVDGDPTPEKLALVPGATVDGMLAEEAIVHEDFLVTIPPHLTFKEAATLPCAGVTAWNALFVEGHAKPGSTVLLLGTGGVSIWALQLAKAAGLRTIVTSSSDEKIARAIALGARAGVNYKNEGWVETLQETGGFDITVDGAAGDGPGAGAAGLPGRADRRDARRRGLGHLPAPALRAGAGHRAGADRGPAARLHRQRLAPHGGRADQ